MTPAGKHFAGRPSTDRPRQVRASAWLKPGRYKEDAAIVEQSWPMLNYEAVLTLLWIDDEIQDDDELWPGFA